MLESGSSRIWRLNCRMHLQIYDLRKWGFVLNYNVFEYEKKIVKLVFACLLSSFRHRSTINSNVRRFPIEKLFISTSYDIYHCGECFEDILEVFSENLNGFQLLFCAGKARAFWKFHSMWEGVEKSPTHIMLLCEII